MKKQVSRAIRLLAYGEKGFTLIELLVVVVILGVLSATAIPNVAQFIGRGKQEAADMERANVQTAMDCMMADRQIKNVTGVTAATNDMNAFPVNAHNATGETALYPDYMRTQITAHKYTCGPTGSVTQTFVP